MEDLPLVKSSLWGRVKSLMGLGTPEGAWRGPFTGMSELGNPFMLGSLDDGWQRNLSVGTGMSVPASYSCRHLYGRAMSQLQPNHQNRAKSGWVTSYDSPVGALLYRPNSYETWSQFVYNSVLTTLEEGEALAVAERDGNNRVVAIHRMPRRSWSPMIEPESHSLFYGVTSSNQGLFPLPPDMFYPSRDVAHFRLYCPRHPLIGESPVKAHAIASGIQVALSQSQLVFYSNLSRPSGFLSTDEKIPGDMIERLKQAWMKASADLSQGKVPILTNGLKFQSMSVPQSDQQLIEQQRLSTADIARVYGVPIALISESPGAQGATEALIQHWLSNGLGAMIEMFEQELEKFFNLPRTQRIELDTAPLLRTDVEKRANSSAKLVQGGILTPDEARSIEGLPPIEGGDQAFMQRQNTPLNLLAEIAANEVANATSDPEVDPSTPQIPSEPAPPAPPPPAKEIDIETARALYEARMKVKRAA